MTSTLEGVDPGRRIGFSFEDLLKYHGPGSPGGVAHAFEVLARALDALNLEMADRVMARPAAEVYDAVRSPSGTASAATSGG